jgi:hypothetical protein
MFPNPADFEPWHIRILSSPTVGRRSVTVQVGAVLPPHRGPSVGAVRERKLRNMMPAHETRSHVRNWVTIVARDVNDHPRLYRLLRERPTSQLVGRSSVRARRLAAESRSRRVYTIIALSCDVDGIDSEVNAKRQQHWQQHIWLYEWNQLLSDLNRLIMCDGERKQRCVSTSYLTWTYFLDSDTQQHSVNPSDTLLFLLYYTIFAL